jgi:hypothetical protein
MSNGINTKKRGMGETPLAGLGRRDAIAAHNYYAHCPPGLLPKLWSSRSARVFLRAGARGVPGCQRNAPNWAGFDCLVQCQDLMYGIQSISRWALAHGLMRRKPWASAQRLMPEIRV